MLFPSVNLIAGTQNDMGTQLPWVCTLGSRVPESIAVALPAVLPRNRLLSTDRTQGLTVLKLAGSYHESK